MTQTVDSNAIIWDFDGTLVDTHRKNLNVTMAIIQTVTGEHALNFNAQKSLENYKLATARIVNWRDFYSNEFGLTESDIDHAGQLWTKYQLRDTTETVIYDGIADVLETLKHLRHGIVSQNSKENIIAILKAGDLEHHFSAIVGYNEVDFRKQKPAPEGLLKCLRILTQLKPGHVFYIGDHETDVLSVVRAKEVIERWEKEIEITSIGACYGSSREDISWSVKPDYLARKPEDIVNIVESHFVK